MRVPESARMRACVRVLMLICASPMVLSWLGVGEGRTKRRSLHMCASVYKCVGRVVAHGRLIYYNEHGTSARFPRPLDGRAAQAGVTK